MLYNFKTMHGGVSSAGYRCRVSSELRHRPFDVDAPRSTSFFPISRFHVQAVLWRPKALRWFLDNHCTKSVTDARPKAREENDKQVHSALREYDSTYFLQPIAPGLSRSRTLSNSPEPSRSSRIARQAGISPPLQHSCERAWAVKCGEECN